MSTVLDWDSYFMNMAVLASKKSKDSNTQVGAVLVKDKKIVGVGYNGFPRGIDDTLFPTSREGVWLETKYPYVVHAEQNALLNTTVFDVSNSTVYVTLFPCNNCALSLIQKGIKEVVYLSDKHKDDDIYIASHRLLDLANVLTKQYSGRIIVDGDLYIA